MGVPFERRVEAQRALDRLAWYHQAGTMAGFEEKVPRAVQEARVRTTLGRSVALDLLWGTRLDEDALQRELTRISKSTLMPERLREIYDTLGNDPILIRECLARPLLTDRLARGFFSTDQRIHKAERREAETLREELLRGWIDPADEHPRRRLIEVRLSPAGRAAPVLGPSAQSGQPRMPLMTRPPSRSAGAAGAAGEGGGSAVIDLEPEMYTWLRDRAPGRPGVPGPLTERPGGFIQSVVLSEESDSFLMAVYTIPKVTFEVWWRENSPAFESAAADGAELDGDDRPFAIAPKMPPFLPIPRGDRLHVPSRGTAVETCLPDDVWDNGVLDDLPDPRIGHTAVWTGSVMIVWGGSNGANGTLGTGGVYDPATDSWFPVTRSGAPQERTGHTAVWTGQEMIVWGGSSLTFSGALDTGGRYDPISDSWTPLATTAAPMARAHHTAVWTGSEMVVWGGAGAETLGSGGRYDPASDSWVSTSPIGGPQARSHHTAVWTGQEMIVWGGLSAVGQVLASGARYDPLTDTWTSTTMTGAPAGRQGHTAVWTGSLMIVWGSDSFLRNGGRYDPVADSWSGVTLAGAPAGRAEHAAVWTGGEMIVWGGADFFSGLATGGRYDPVTDRWNATSLTNAPQGRELHTAVWTGSLMIVWGGSADQSGFAMVNTGGRYDPATGLWTPTSIAAAPAARFGHTSVWTGNLMVVWGGGEPGAGLGDTGGRYDPVTDTWTETSMSGAPSPRLWHTAVWTGGLMLVWGGQDDTTFVSVATGGRYDPITDTWSSISNTGAPAARIAHTAVWSGREMMVWGGAADFYSGSEFSSGGRYDPVSDAWNATSLTGAPSARRYHTAVWTGSLMLIWGGGICLDTGARYDPVTDIWSPVTQIGAPSGRGYGHTAVWTGIEMIVWGGSDCTSNTGGRYDPAADSWTSTSTGGAPTPRGEQTAVWNGASMLVWGGYDTGYAGTGGRYDTATDSWSAIDPMSAPAGRSLHTAIEAGGLMIVWGGWNNDPLGSGGRYAVGQSDDTDLDGLTVCAGDCDDANPLVFALPTGITGLMAAGPATTLLDWDDQASVAGTGTSYEIVSGSIGAAGIFDGATASCLGLAPTTGWTDDRPGPSPGTAAWYLVRARNSCGAGTWGNAIRDATILTCP